MDWFTLKNDNDEYLINYISLMQCKVIHCIKESLTHITINDMSRFTGLSSANCLKAVESLMELNLISLNCHIDDFIALDRQGKLPVFSLHFENVESAIMRIKETKSWDD